MLPDIVLQTDFGLTTGFVASMYGVIRMVDQSLDVFDLNHEIRPFDMRQGSFLLRDTIPYWKGGTVFVSVVDPGVGTARRGCVAKLNNGSFVVTPDNGSLTAILDWVVAVREIDESVNRLKGSDKANSFHGRDVFAYTAARLASGIINFEGVGPEYPVNEIVTFETTHSHTGLPSRPLLLAALSMCRSSLNRGLRAGPPGPSSRRRALFGLQRLLARNSRLVP